jgi:hypothetical protein
MQTYQYVYLVLALVIWILGYFHTGRLVRPRWKIPGKFIFYLGVSAALVFWLEHFSLMFIIGHPTVGLIFHTSVCKKHGINWWTCEPVEKYLSLQDKWAQGDW